MARTVFLLLDMADAATVENLVGRRRKAAKNDPVARTEVAALEAAGEVLEAGTPLYRASLPADVMTALKPSFLLTAKPVLAVVNVGEDDVADLDAAVKPVADALGGSADVLGVCVQLEAEAARLDAAERAELLEGLGLGEGALARVTRAAYHLLGRRPRPGVRGRHPLRPPAGFHPGRGDPLGRAALAGFVARRQGGGPAAGGGQGLRGARRRRPRDPLQRVRARDGVAPA